MQDFEKPIILVGMMGSGKSALAKKCAELSGVSAFDSDQEVERRAGCSIRDIFKNDGEQRFRVLEREVVGALLDRGPCLIATGGGAILDQQTRALMKDKAVSVWLDVPVDELYARIQGDASRPLLQTEDPKAALADLLAQRVEYYKQADIHLKISNEILSETAQRLLKDIAQHGAA